MNFNNRSNLFKHLKDKNVFIWGARMTGIGALRQLKKEDINVVSFIILTQHLRIIQFMGFL